jgi:taurine transport system substrate-binding protein
MSTPPNHPLSRWRVRVVVPALASLLLAACGGASAPTPASSAPPPTSAAPKPPASSAPATVASGPASAKPATSGSAAAKPGASTPASAKAAPASGGAALTLSFSATTASQSPATIAQELGLYQKYGLGKTDLRFLASGPLSVTALVSGDVDAQITGGDAIVGARIKGSPGIMLGAFKNYLTGSIMAKPGIDSVKQIKTMATSRLGSNTHYMSLQVLKRNGIDPKSVTFIQAGTNANVVAALSTGQVDAAAAVPPDDLASKGQGAHLLVDVTALKIPYPAATIATTEATLQKKPEAMRSLLQALGEGMHIYLNDPNKAVPIIQKLTKLDDVATVQAAYESEKAVMEPDLAARPEAIAAVLEEQAQSDPAAKDFKPDQFIDTKLQKELVDSGFFKNLK